MHLLRAVKSTIGFILEAFPYLHSVGAISYYNILFICLGKKITPMIERLQAELDIRNAEPATVPQDELEKMMQEADEKAKKSLQAEIDRLKN